MSQGDRNWPFLMLTGLPTAATFWMKSVCRHRNAGVCSTSTTSATTSNGVYSCTSVSTGTPICFFTSPRMRRPSSIPSPRKLLPDVRLALSKLDLKMKLMPSLPVISFKRPAASSCSCSDSTTHGPAIRKNGRSSPTSNPQRFMQVPSYRHSGQGMAGTQTQGREKLSSRCFLRELRRIAHSLVLARGAHEAVEQRMAIARRGREFRMELARQEPRMFLPGQLDDLDQVVDRQAGDHEAGLLQAFAIAVVEFEAMTVAFADGVGAVQFARKRPGLELAFLRTEAHGAAKVRSFIASLHFARTLRPLGDQRDHRVGAIAVVLGGTRSGNSGDVAREFHHRRVHAVADAEIRNASLARVLHRLDLAFEAALAETAGHQDRIGVVQHRIGTARFDGFRIHPFKLHAGCIVDAAMAQRLSQSEREPTTTPTRGATVVFRMVSPAQNGYCTGMDKRLLDILCDPVTRTPVRPLRRDELDALNRAIAAGSLDTVAGQKVAAPLSSGLITTDRKVVYRIEDDIPVMLAEEGIGTLQLADFPT